MALVICFVKAIFISLALGVSESLCKLYNFSNIATIKVKIIILKSERTIVSHISKNFGALIRNYFRLLHFPIHSGDFSYTFRFSISSRRFASTWGFSFTRGGNSVNLG